MRFGSVCSGIEAASVAWHPLGWSAAWFSEIEPFPCSLLSHHFPDIPNYGDMAALPDRIRSGEVESPDVLCGGTPCQAFSVAGKRESLADARGNLSLVFCEIADAIDDIRRARGGAPAIIFWENVPGVLSTKDNAFGCFLGALAGEDCELQPPGGKWKNAGCVHGPQRAVAWRVLDAQYFGVAQRRRRVFVVASARDGFDPAAVLFEFEGVRRDTAPSREPRESFAHEVAPCLTSSGRGVERTGDTRGQDPVVAVTCMAHGQGGAEISENRSPTLTCNHEAPIAAYNDPRQSVTGALCAADGKGANGQHADDHKLVPVYTVHGTQDPDIRIGHAHTLGRNNGAENAVCYDDLRRFNAPHGGLEHGDIHPTLESTNPKQIVCVTGDIAHTLKTDGHDGGEDGTGRGQPIVAAAFAENSRTKVRRLTPVECERLQGFPDDWTLVPHRGKPAADGPRYKAIGNSWAVPCVRWIGARIDREARKS